MPLCAGNELLDDIITFTSANYPRILSANAIIRVTVTAWNHNNSVLFVRNSIKMNTVSNGAATNKSIGLDNACEKHEREFFSLFDFPASGESTSKNKDVFNQAERTGSPLKSFQGAASAVFGRLWSALDTAIAILNEEMEDSTEEILSVPDDGTDCDSLGMMSESIRKPTEYYLNNETAQSKAITTSKPNKETKESSPTINETSTGK